MKTDFLQYIFNVLFLLWPLWLLLFALGTEVFKALRARVR
jgi:hypothetical protein